MVRADFYFGSEMGSDGIQVRGTCMNCSFDKIVSCIYQIGQSERKGSKFDEHHDPSKLDTAAVFVVMSSTVSHQD